MTSPELTGIVRVFMPILILPSCHIVPDLDSFVIGEVRKRSHGATPLI